MYRKELNERSPLRLFEHSIHGGLGRGNVGGRNSRTDQTLPASRGNQDYSSIRRGVRRRGKRSEAFHHLLECGRD